MPPVAPTTVEASDSVLRETFFQATNYHSIPGGRKKLDYLLSVVRRLQSERSEVRVLDVGCGNGGLAFPLAAIGCSVLGVDVHAPTIERNRAQNAARNARFEAVPGAVFDLGETFDLIVCSEVLEHLDEPQPLVATMSRHLEPDGLLIITVPNGYGLREVLGRGEIFLRETLGLSRVIDPIRRAIGGFDASSKLAVHTSNPDAGHVQQFTVRQIDRHLRSAGLTRIETPELDLHLLGHPGEESCGRPVRRKARGHAPEFRVERLVLSVPQGRVAPTGWASATSRAGKSMGRRIDS